MIDIAIENVRIFFDDQVVFNYFTVAVFVVGVFIGKFFKIPKRLLFWNWNKGDTRNESDNIQSHNKNLKLEFNLIKVNHHPPAKGPKNKPNENEDE